MPITGSRSSTAAAAPGSSNPNPISTGPLNPGPNPSDNRSYARLVVLDVGRLPESEEPSLIASTGAARSSSIPSESTKNARGVRWIARLSR